MVVLISLLGCLSVICMGIALLSLPIMMLMKKGAKKSLLFFGISFFAFIALMVIYVKAIPESTKEEIRIQSEERAKEKAEEEARKEAESLSTAETTTAEASTEMETEPPTEAVTETAPEATTEAVTEGSTEPSAEETTTSSGDPLMDSLKSILSDKVAEEAYDLIVNQIGFSGARYKGKNSMGNDNYDFVSDSFSFTLTASDDVYRIFQPGGGATFYSDGAVKHKVSDYVNTSSSIDQYDAIYYMQIAEEIVKGNLKDPRSAKFPSIVTNSSEIGMQKKGDIVGVQSYVDATNSFGAKVRTKWLVEFEVVDLSKYSYKTVYIKIGDSTAGEYVDLN